MSQKYEVFGKYVLLDKIAAGGMAEVYRAKAPGAEGIGKILAIKRILPQYSSNSEFIDMFKTEAKIAINLTQANIGQIYEFGVESEQFFLLMEFIDGRNLRQVLSRCTKVQKALTIEQCVFIIGQVSNGLDYAHRCIDKNTGGPLNIIHRDMSPQNIMVSFEGEVKIVDFGIAKAESKIEVTRAGTLKGKFGYMSPEQAEGLDLDARTDIFSTGIVLWELLSGERLFVANNEVNTIRKIKECQIPSLRKINPHIHEELERITMKALAKDRNLRYQTSAELHRDLSRFLYRVNPEFTSHDLSVAIKTLFKEDILQDRKKSIEYSKVNLPSIRSKRRSKSHKTVEEKTVPSINTITESNNSQLSASASTATEGVTDKGTDRGHGEKQSLDPKEVKLDPAPNENQFEIVRQTSTPIRPPNTATGFEGGTTRTNFRSALHTNSGLRGNNHVPNITKWLPTILFVLSVGGGGLFFLKNYDKVFDTATRFFKSIGNRGSNTIHNIESTMLGSGDPKEGEVPLATPEPIKVHLIVHSVPAGAQITIDGENVGSTPAEVKIDMNKKITLSIKREGYIPYVKDILATSSPEEFTATLQKAAIGYINIEVQPTSADVFIDNQKLAEKLPITRYPVQAGKTLVIKAVNPYLNTFDEQTVMVKQDTVKSITLFLRKSRNPASP